MTARPPSTPAARRARWIDALDKINRRLVQLRQQRHYFNQLVTLGLRTPELRPYTMFAQWFAAFAAMAIRREVDDSRDVVSLTMILDEVSRFPEEFIDFQGQPGDRMKLRADRRELGAISRKVVALADKEIAHAVLAGLPAADRPTLSEILACVDKFESLSIWYIALFTGESMITTDGGFALPVRIAGAPRRRPR